MTSISQGASTSASVQISGYQWIYGPLAAQTISGNVTARVRGRAATFINLYNARIALWVATPAAGLRGTLYAASSAFEATDWSTSFANYSATVTTSSVAVTAGDYLVLEVGSNRNAFLDNDTSFVEIGDTNASNYMYFDFVNTISFQAPIIGSYSGGSPGNRFKKNRVINTIVFNNTGGAADSWTLLNGTILPPGLTMNSSTGDISGTPTRIGFYRADIRASNEGGNYDFFFNFIVFDDGGIVLNNSLKMGVTT